MLRMNMTNAERDLVAVHKKALSIYPYYRCNCCRTEYMRGQGNALIDIFRPPKGIRMCIKQCAATFVLCETCQKLPDKEIHKGVLAGFLMEKMAITA